jgi:hypothetical protein
MTALALTITELAAGPGHGSRPLTGSVTAGVISAIWVVSDDPGRLRQLDAARLT